MVEKCMREKQFEKRRRNFCFPGVSSSLKNEV